MILFILAGVPIVIARLQEDLTGLQLEAPMPVLAGMRGRETAKALTYDTNELEISLLIQTDMEHPEQSMLLGWVSSCENDQAVEAYLWQATLRMLVFSLCFAPNQDLAENLCDETERSENKRKPQPVFG